MKRIRSAAFVTRREILRASVSLGTCAVAEQFLPVALSRAAALGDAPQKAAAPVDAVAAGRAVFGAIPIEVKKLSERLTLLSGPGGNIIVLTGPDGNLMIDTFVRPAWPKLQAALAGIGAAHVATVIDSHWHFDHTDNNASLHAAGATILAHANTLRRMSQAHYLAFLGMHFPPAPVAARPQKIFQTTQKLSLNGQTLALSHLPPAHTDTDISVHFQEANILHTGDVFFNGLFPYIDRGTGGSLSGMILGTGALLAVVDNQTRIVPGHGPVGNKGDLMKFRAMLSEVQGRLRKLKSAGKSLEEAAAAKPLADLDAAWGKGTFNADAFVQIAYPTV